MLPEPARPSYLQKGRAYVEKGRAWIKRGHGVPSSSGNTADSRPWMPSGLRLRRFLRLGMIGVMAILHMAVLATLLSQYYSPQTLISMQITEEEVSLIAPPKRLLPAGIPAPSAAPALLQAIRELKRSGVAEPRFISMAEAEIVARLEAALQLEDFDPTSELGLDKNAFCQLVAVHSNMHNNTGDTILFEAPRVRVDAPGVVLTTYFNSRVDPLRCYKHKGGRIEADALGYMEHWYQSVVRLGLPAVVFHESLSLEFVERVQTDLVRFQRVQLSHHSWSLCDERWAVYLDWLQRSGSSVRFVLQVDISDTVLAQDPFQLFASQSGQYDLWVNVQRNTEWVQQNYQDCYGGPQPYVLGEQGLVYNAGVVGGKRRAFEDLATAILKQFEPLYGRGVQSGKAVWNCDMAALQYTLTHPSFQSGHRVFNGGYPFCAGGIKCWKHGECKYYVYHK